MYTIQVKRNLDTVIIEREQDPQLKPQPRWGFCARACSPRWSSGLRHYHDESLYMAPSSKLLCIARGEVLSLLKACVGPPPSHGSFITRPNRCREHCMAFNKGLLQFPHQFVHANVYQILTWKVVLGPFAFAWQPLFKFHGLKGVKDCPWPLRCEEMLGSSALARMYIKVRSGLQPLL